MTPGETVHVEAELVEKEPREHPRASGLVRYDTRVVTGDGDVALTCKLLSLVR